LQEKEEAKGLLRTIHAQRLAAQQHKQ